MIKNDNGVDEMIDGQKMETVPWAFQSLRCVCAIMQFIAFQFLLVCMSVCVCTCVHVRVYVRGNTLSLHL